MDPITAKLMSAAGAASDPIYVDDVFSCDAYQGNGSTQNITNGIDLAGEGGWYGQKKGAGVTITIYLIQKGGQALR